MIVAAYVYWPAIYLAVYVPFVVPRLPTWNHVPTPFFLAIVGVYIVVLLLAGRSLGHGWIALHAIGIALSADAFALVVSWLRAPGFRKAFQVGLDPWDVLATAAHAIIVVIFLEGGRALGRLAGARGRAA